MNCFYDHSERYRERLGRALVSLDWTAVEKLAATIWSTMSGRDGTSVYLIGNGGSAANASHLANDLRLVAIRAHALAADGATLTCLANDCGYDTVFMLQLALLAQPGDVLIALSGSGNSPNVLRAIEHANRSQMRSFAIVGYDGGQAKTLAQTAIHAKIDDMQVCEDIQLVVGHTIMQWIRADVCAS